ELLDRDAAIGLAQKPDNLCFRKSLLHRPTLSLSRTLNRNATQKWGGQPTRRGPRKMQRRARLLDYPAPEILNNNRSMAKKTKKPRGSNDPALSAFKALQHVIEQTETPPNCLTSCRIGSK